MKENEQIEIWLHGTIRAWLVSENSEMEARLYTEAITLIWVLHRDATWAGARAIFEEMRVKLDKEMDYANVQSAPTTEVAPCP